MGILKGVKNFFKTDDEFVFSIIIAVYNVEDYLDDAISSIINQSFDFSKVQVILVDDGSVDNSKKICQKYADKYPNNILYLHQKNQGQSIARNHGLKYVKGKYVNFLDSDDLLQSNALSEVNKFFNKHDGEIDVITIPRYTFESRNGLLNPNYNYDTRVMDIIEEYNFPQTAVNASFIRADALNEKFDGRIMISEDSVFINKIILEKCKCGIVGSTRYFYRKRKANNSLIDVKKFDKNYFNPRMKYYFKELIDYTIKKRGHVLKYIQSVLMYDLKWLFRDNTEKGILKGDELDEFYGHVYDVIQVIDDEIILSSDISNFIKYRMLNFKYGKSNFEIEYEGDVFYRYEGHIFDKLSNYEMKVTDIDIDGDTFKIKCFFIFYPGDISFKAFNNDSLLSLKCVDIEKVYSMGKVLRINHFYEITGRLDEGINKISFKAILDSNEYLLNIRKSVKLDVESGKNYIVLNNL